MQETTRLGDVDVEYVPTTIGISIGDPLSILPRALVLNYHAYAVPILENVTFLRQIAPAVILTQIQVLHSKYIKMMHNTINKLKFKLAIGKTYIGKIA